MHPRNEKTIQATQDWERGRTDQRTLREAFRNDCRSFVDLQTTLEFDYVSDGQLGLAWQDFFRPLVNGVDGLQKGPMVRWFNTNTFYQTPVVTGELGTNGSVFWKVVERVVMGGKLPCKVIVPDPLTFAELSDDRFYGSREKLLFAFADRVLAEELRRLEKNGVKYVQFSSPSLVARFREKPISRDLLGQLGESIRSAIKGTSIRTGFYTFFGDASPYIPFIFDLIPTDDIGFDFTETDPDSITPSRKGIIAGVSDARTTYLETLQELTAKVVAISERTASKSIILSPSADLRYIPRTSADAKLRRLAELRERVTAS